MTSPSLAVERTGLVTSIGLTAASTCAALRAKVSNSTQTHFLDEDGEPCIAHQVTLDRPYRGVAKLARMAALAIQESFSTLETREREKIPILLCVAEKDRAGREANLDERLVPMIQRELGFAVASGSELVPRGRTSVPHAIARARQLIEISKFERVVVAATDSLVNWPALGQYEKEGRLLTSENANGFVPGEAAGAVLLRAATGQPRELVCAGVGFGWEAAHLTSGRPLRADGMSRAVLEALSQANLRMGDVDLRIADFSGEQYYFKEAALAYLRTTRSRREESDIWHPAEGIGEVGAAIGAAIVALAHSACVNGYAPGANILAHLSSDAGERAALALQYDEAA